MAKNLEAPSVLEGVSFDWRLPTRKEEYGLLVEVARDIKPGTAYDAGTGYIKEWHVAPYILAAMGWKVQAWDSDIRTLDMPKNDQITRVVANMNDYIPVSPFGDDLLISISVLEHCEASVQEAFAQMASDCVRPGGTLFVTADGIQPQHLAQMFEPFFYTGADMGLNGSPLVPEVSYLIATRRP